MATAQPPQQELQGLTGIVYVHDADAAAKFYTEVLGATEAVRYSRKKDNRAAHVELQFESETLYVMLADDFSSEQKIVAAKDEPSDKTFWRFRRTVDDCDAVYKKALAAGATSKQAPQDQPYGARSANITDPFNVQWVIEQTLKAMTDEEINAAMPDYKASTVPDSDAPPAKKKSKSKSEDDKEAGNEEKKESLASVVVPPAPIRTSITVHNAVAALKFYTEVLGGREKVRYAGTDGRIGYSEVFFKDSELSVADAFPSFGLVSAKELAQKGHPCALSISVNDCDAAHAKAVAAGAISQQPPVDMPWGDRSATIVDPFNVQWVLTQQVKVMSVAEIAAAMPDYTATTPSSLPAETFSPLTPSVTVHNATEAIKFYVEQLGAMEKVRFTDASSGDIMHCELVFRSITGFASGATLLQVADPSPAYGTVAANSLKAGEFASSLSLDVGDCKSVYDKCVQGGATSVAPPTQQPWGCVSATIVDPFNVRWNLVQETKRMSAEEIAAAMPGCIASVGPAQGSSNNGAN
eukprot:INCI9722.1.p1 GENE.INCI9722.1~~INCI9722.1.p1  ORF type:complete len:523 (+),score=109.09 INCI9722.1:77-1645(+)